MKNSPPILPNNSILKQAQKLRAALCSDFDRIWTFSTRTFEVSRPDLGTKLRNSMTTRTTLHTHACSGYWISFSLFPLVHSICLFIHIALHRKRARTFSGKESFLSALHLVNRMTSISTTNRVPSYRYNNPTPTTRKQQTSKYDITSIPTDRLEM